MLRKKKKCLRCIKPIDDGSIGRHTKRISLRACCRGRRFLRTATWGVITPGSVWYVKTRQAPQQLADSRALQLLRATVPRLLMSTHSFCSFSIDKQMPRRGWRQPGGAAWSPYYPALIIPPMKPFCVPCRFFGYFIIFCLDLCL